MTQDAGRELDALVAEKVMGLHLDDHRFLWDRLIPHYSTDIAGAWEVVEKIRELRRAANTRIAESLIDGEPSGDIYDHIAFELQLTPDCNEWIVNIYDPPAMYACDVRAKTAPLAICLAALKAVEGD